LTKYRHRAESSNSSNETWDIGYDKTITAGICDDQIPFDPPYCPAEAVEEKVFYPLKPIGEAKSIWEADWDWVRGMNAQYAAQRESTPRPPLTPKDFPYSYAAKMKEPLCRTEETAHLPRSIAHIERMRLDAVRYHTWLRNGAIMSPPRLDPCSHPLWGRLQEIRTHHLLHAREIPERNENTPVVVLSQWKRYQLWLRKHSVTTPDYKNIMPRVKPKLTVGRYKESWGMRRAITLMKYFDEYRLPEEYGLHRVRSYNIVSFFEELGYYLRLAEAPYQLEYSDRKWFKAKHTREPLIRNKHKAVGKRLKELLFGKPISTPRVSIQVEATLKAVHAKLETLATEDQSAATELLAHSMNKLDEGESVSDVLEMVQNPSTGVFESLDEEQKKTLHHLSLKRMWGRMAKLLIPEGYRLKEKELSEVVDINVKRKAG
jgi:hypothetical protein